MLDTKGRAGLVVLLIGLGLAVALVAGAGTAAAQDEEIDQSVVEAANDAINETNANLEAEMHPELELTEPPEGLDPIEAETKDELQDAHEELDAETDRLILDMLHSVVAEINANAEERGVGQIIDPADVQTPQDARDEGDGFVDQYGHIAPERAEDGQDGLYRVANRSEDIEDRFEPVLQDMQNEAYDQMGTVEGTVTGPDGDPLEGVEVTPDTGPGSATTDADGNYEIQVLAEAETLTFEHDEHDAIEESVDVTADETVEQDVQFGGDDADGDGDDGLPGFGVTVAVVTMLGVALVVGRRADR